MNTVKVGGNFKAAFLLYHDFPIKSVVQGESGQIYFEFEDSADIQDTIDDYHDMSRGVDIYVNLTIYNEYLQYVKELIKRYKRDKVNY